MFTPVNVCWACSAGAEVCDVYRGKHQAVALRSGEFENGWFEGGGK